MGDVDAVDQELEGEENLVAAAKHLVRALGSNKNLTSNMKKVLADLGSQLSTMATIRDDKAEEVSEIEEQLNIFQEKIMSGEADQSMIWHSVPNESSGYLDAVDEIRKLIERLDSLCLNKNGHEKELLRRAHDVLQMAMGRLEEEFRHMLVQNRQPFEPEHMSFRSSEEDIMDESFSYGDDSFEESLQRDSLSRTSEEIIIDLVDPDVIPDLRGIANLMFLSNYDHECCQAYVIARKDALDECLFILEMEKLSIEDVLKMEWGNLNSKIKRWVWATKIFVRIYLASEKLLCEQIFGEFGPVNAACFVEASKASMLQLLNFGEAVSIGPHKPEKLFCILDMYEVLADLLPDIDALYADNVGSPIRIEYHEVLRRLGDSVRVTFMEFENAIASYTTSSPFAGGGIHHLTKYVMNYIRTLTDYSETLNFLLKNHDKEEICSLSADENPAKEVENLNRSSSCNFSPMALCYRSITSILESKLQDKSKMFKDVSLQHLFLMNNIHYMAQKVKSSELRVIFGDNWIRKHNGKFQQHAMEYQRATWSSILALLKDDGNSNSSSVSKTQLKERFRRFYAAFEEVYKTQTAWLIPNIQLREDLRISTSQKVIHAYRTFESRHKNHISDKHIKYSADDLQNYLLDFFEGSSKSLHNPHRR
ncbi:Exocyst subunit Exo70 family protein [Melia azedarach]|uniref:Exocyst subunit Exo70 family protein n=2 Tax=Melia azedarach TaxID=155640 RepID=A0ACC1X9C5_MELAZ|nr:Exocyst subunit Exo70 family protein [Melia azedarach]KAJ4707304.1 Exocyst subunit Exo70 family protein [Melia azedarach]